MTQADSPQHDKEQPAGTEQEPASAPGEAAGEGGPLDALEQLEREVTEFRAKADENWQEYLRAAAELANFQKRAAREVENARKYGIERLAGDLVGVVDSLQMGLEAARREGAAGPLVEGQETTLKQLLAVLEKYGVTAVDAQGQAFDPEYHEAMTMVRTDEVPPGTVTAVIQTGYLLHDRLLRPARVMVAAEPGSTEPQQ